jgi:hypothetical protein
VKANLLSESLKYAKDSNSAEKSHQQQLEALQKELRDLRDEAKVCPICYECIFDLPELSQTYCGHLYCTSCFESSMARSNEKECPYCKTNDCHLNLLEVHTKDDHVGKGEKLVMALAFKIVNKLHDYPSLDEIYGIHFDPNHPPSQFSYDYVMFKMLNPDVDQRVTSQEALKLMKAVQTHRLQLPPVPPQIHN